MGFTGPPHAMCKKIDKCQEHIRVCVLCNDGINSHLTGWVTSWDDDKHTALYNVYKIIETEF